MATLSRVLDVFSDGSINAYEPQPKYGFLLRCFEWTATVKDPITGKLLYSLPGQLVRGVSAQTRAEIDEKKSKPVLKSNPSPSDTGEDLFVKSIPSGCRFLETRYTTDMKAKGWRKLTIDVWQEITGFARTVLEALYDKIYYPYRFLNNKAVDAQDAIASDGATVELTGNHKRIGQEWYEFFTLKGDDDAPNMSVCNPWDHPTRWFYLTTSQRKNYSGSGLLWYDEHITSDWGYGWRIPVPLLSPTGRNWLPVGQLRFTNQIINPFYP